MLLLAFLLMWFDYWLNLGTLVDIIRRVFLYGRFILLGISEILARYILSWRHDINHTVSKVWTGMGYTDDIKSYFWIVSVLLCFVRTAWSVGTRLVLHRRIQFLKSHGACIQTTVVCMKVPTHMMTLASE